jgi:glyoxylase-like metal-dependent hydrolase (beta-lactamase superfamily II)
MGEHIHPLPDDGCVPGLPGWRVVHTPGHTAGHISLVRESDRLVLAGDALATMNQDSWTTLVTMPRELRWPPAPLTSDWSAARTSLHRLAELRPSAIAAGHGLPMSGPEVAEQLERFARHFMPPRDGRYVRQAAFANENGVVSLPPPVPDPVGTAILAATATAATAGFAIALARSRRRV